MANYLHSLFLRISELKAGYSLHYPFQTILRALKMGVFVARVVKMSLVAVKAVAPGVVKLNP